MKDPRVWSCNCGCFDNPLPECPPLDPFLLGMAMDMTDDDDATLGVVGRGTKAERVAARYAELAKQ
jgi:hypothetical protein